MFKQLRFFLALGGFTALGYGLMLWQSSAVNIAENNKPVMLKKVISSDSASPTFGSSHPAPIANNEEIPLLPRYMQDIAIDGGIDIDSQGDVVSNQNLRDFFEFYLSLQGDLNLDQITQLLRLKTQGTDNEFNDIGRQVMQLFGQYIDYKTALTSLSEQSLSALELLAAKQHLQQQFFEPQQAEQLFGDENNYMAYGIYKYQQQGLEPEYQQQLSADAAANMGFDDQQANSRYQQQQQQLSALAEISHGSTEERFVAREALVGKAAAGRLQQLDQQRQQWQQKVSDYQLEMANLAAVAGLAESDIAEQRQRYIDQHFSANEQKRLTATTSPR